MNANKSGCYSFIARLRRTTEQKQHLRLFAVNL